MCLQSGHTVRGENDLGELAWIISFILADGTLTLKGFRIQISEKNEKMCKIIMKKFKKIFKKDLKLIKRINTNILQLKSKEIFIQLTKLGVEIGEKSHKVRIPKWILTHKSLLREFIGAWFDAEGTVKVRKFGKRRLLRLVMASKSEKLIRELSIVLKKKFGICTWKWKEKDGIWRIEIKNSHIKNFLKEIPSRHPSKIQKIKEFFIS